jgi:mRNA interferase MazF
MPNTIGYSFGDIVLVSFPFTDQSTTKRRPAVVISSPAYHRERADLIIMAVTSQVRARVPASATFTSETGKARDLSNRQTSNRSSPRSNTH